MAQKVPQAARFPRIERHARVRAVASIVVDLAFFLSLLSLSLLPPNSPYRPSKLVRDHDHQRDPDREEEVHRDVGDEEAEALSRLGMKKKLLRSRAAPFFLGDGVVTFSIRDLLRGRKAKRLLFSTRKEMQTRADDCARRAR